MNISFDGPIRDHSELKPIPQLEDRTLILAEDADFKFSDGKIVFTDESRKRINDSAKSGGKVVLMVKGNFSEFEWEKLVSNYIGEIMISLVSIDAQEAAKRLLDKCVGVV